MMSRRTDKNVLYWFPTNGKFYNDIVAKFTQLVASEGVPMSTGTSIKFETNLSIWIDVIAYFRTPMFIYVTFDNNDEFEVNTLKKYCNDCNIKLLIYRGKENHEDIEQIYKEAKENMYQNNNTFIR